jgi:uncharacterized protein (TIGR02145 family)
MNKTKFISLTAGMVLAMAFTFSCYGDDGGDKGNDIGNYRTVVIGTQTWMAENLNYAVEGSKCYDNDPANCVKYGRLYDWATAMALPPSCNSNSCSSQIQPKHRGICPIGWHIPSEADWTTLTDYAGGFSTAGPKLKATSGWINRGDGSSGNGTDQYGFSALPGGYGNPDGSFSNIGGHGDWWSASEYNSNNAHYRGVYFNVDHAGWYSYGDKSGPTSVRCIKD